MNKFSSEIRIPGFRPGKAPDELIRRRYAKELEEELKRKIISKAYEKVTKDSELDIFAIVEVENEKLELGAEATISFTVDLRPTFELPEYKGITTEVSQDEVKESEVETAIDEIRNQRAEYNVVEQAAQKGDYVKVSYEGKIDDQPIIDLVPDHPIYGRQSMTWEEAGATDKHIPGVRAVIDGLVGMKAGDKQSVSMDFPKDFEVKALAEKTATYSIEVSEVREKKLPELNEDFFKSLKIESLQHLKEHVQKELNKRKEQERFAQQQQQVIEAIVSKIDFSLPQSAVEQEARSLLTEYMRRKKLGAAEQERELKDPKLTEEVQKIASKRVKLEMILEKIAKVETIKIEQQELQNAIMHEAMATKTPPKELVKELQKNSERVAEIRRRLLFDKTLKFIVEQAVVSPLQNVES